MIAPGPFAPRVTQHQAGPGSQDAYGNDVLTFTDRPVIALAEYPGGGGAGRATSTESEDVLTADKVLLLQPTATVDPADEFTATDGLRYRVNGYPALFASPLTGTSVLQVALRRITTSS